MTARQRFARLVTDVVVRWPRLWVLFRRPLARMFDGIAAEWDRLRVTPVHLAPLEAALDRIHPGPKRALDLGTGTGAAARSLTARWPGAEVIGVDVSTEMIREARARASSGRERYEVADAAALPFEDALFDVVTLMNMIPFFDELARVTAPGGAVVAAYSRGAETPIWVPFRRLRAELAARGFGSFEELAAGNGMSLLAVKARLS